MEGVGPQATERSASLGDPRRDLQAYAIGGSPVHCTRWLSRRRRGSSSPRQVGRVSVDTIHPPALVDRSPSVGGSLIPQRYAELHRRARRSVDAILQLTRCPLLYMS